MESPVQDKPKEDHAQAHINQTVKTEYKEKYEKPKVYVKVMTMKMENYNRIKLKVLSDGL